MLLVATAVLGWLVMQPQYKPSGTGNSSLPRRTCWICRCLKRAQAQQVEGWGSALTILPTHRPRTGTERPRAPQQCRDSRRAWVSLWLWGKTGCPTRRGKRVRGWWKEMDKEAEGICGQLLRGLGRVPPLGCEGTTLVLGWAQCLILRPTPKVSDLETLTRPPSAPSLGPHT